MRCHKTMQSLGKLFERQYPQFFNKFWAKEREGFNVILMARSACLVGIIPDT